MRIRDEPLADDRRPSRRSTSAIRLALALLAFTLAGCGPTPEQYLLYQLVVAVLGLALGLTMWALGRRISRRWHNWFVCSFCIRPQIAAAADGTMQTCPGCGERSSVNYLSPQNIRAIDAGKELRHQASRKRTALWALVLAILTLGILCVPGILTQQIWTDDPPWPTEFENWVLFPITFVIGGGDPSWPGISWGVCFGSFSIVAMATGTLKPILSETVMLGIGYTILLFALSIHWYAGLRRWRRGWLLPVALQLVNVAIALLAYWANWWK